MNLKDLKYFVAVAKTRHFGRAAQQCFVSQPTLSGQIKKLEGELGVVLFERTHHYVSLTRIGEQILVHAQAALQEAESIRGLAQVYKDPLAGELRIGVIPTLSPYLMPLVLMPMHRQYVQVQLSLREEVTENLLRCLHDNSLDAILLATPVKDPDLAVIPLFREPFWFVHPRQHSLYTKDEITCEDLSQVDLLLLSDAHCLTRQVLETCTQENRSKPAHLPDLRAESLDTLLQLVGSGLGCTLVPALAIRGAWMTDTGVIARQLSNTKAYRDVSLVFRRSFPRRQVLEVFCAVVHQYLPNTVQPLSVAENG